MGENDGVRCPLYQLDAFATRRFEGNPAAVMLFDEFPSDATMQALAAENNLSETAFLLRDGADYRIRWFTPRVEVPLCGHATLASAAVVMERLEPKRGEVVFHSASGPLRVTRTPDGYSMDFPARPAVRMAHLRSSDVDLADHRAKGALDLEHHGQVQAFRQVADRVAIDSPVHARGVTTGRWEPETCSGPDGGLHVPGIAPLLVDFRKCGFGHHVLPAQPGKRERVGERPAS